MDELKELEPIAYPYPVDMYFLNDKGEGTLASSKDFKGIMMIIERDKDFNILRK